MELRIIHHVLWIIQSTTVVVDGETVNPIENGNARVNYACVEVLILQSLRRLSLQ